VRSGIARGSYDALMVSLDLFRLDDRVAVVTGASSGLGVAFAQGLAEAGADVVLGARRIDRLNETASLVEAAGRRAIAVETDVTDPDACTALVQEGLAAFGKVDVLVNNAGMSPVYPSVEAVSEELWDKVLDVNLKGPFRLAAIVGERMRRDGGGSIVTVSSIAARYPSADVVSHAAAKAGVNGRRCASTASCRARSRRTSRRRGTWRRSSARRRASRCAVAASRGRSSVR
jgi:NAD(P)-dependent dehydrogenase (short-subunit alcohol dehydrogenase family)